MDKSKNLKRRLYNVSKKTGLGKIYVVYGNSGTEKYFPTNVSLHPDKWDKKLNKQRKGSLKPADEQVVENLYNKTLQLITNYQFNNEGHLPPIAFLEEHLNKKEESEDIHELFTEYLEDKKRVESSTIETYTFAADLLKEVDKHYKYKLNLNNFNYTFIQKFITYCHEIKKNSNNTITYRLSVYKGFVNYLNKREIKHNIKPENWEKLDKNSNADLLCLEKDELQQIMDFECSGARQQKIKDIIVILSHTGMRITDLQHITKNQIINDCIDYIPAKTKRKGIRAVVPISKPVRDILERYNYKPPYMLKDNVNNSIRKFCANIPLLQENIRYIEVSGAEEKEVFVPKYTVLTSHSIGRKTFINLVIQAGVPIPTLMGFTGHSTLDTVIKNCVNKHINKLPQLNKVFEF